MEQIGGGSFLRWAGGKNWFCAKIKKYLPTTFTDYYEPFLGGGSVFFWLAKNKLIKNECVLSDLNSDLIQAYNDIKYKSDWVVSQLSSMRYTEEEYYEIRSIYNASNCPTEKKGIYFIYLNRTGFNGIYRVSRNGIYNVPFGSKSGYISDDYAGLLKSDSLLLKRARITQASFSYILNPDFHCKEHSLFFLDPPYTVSHNENGFIAYNKNLFSLDNQFLLRRVLDKIDSEGSFFIMTNAHHKKIREIFDGYYFHEESRASVIGGRNAKRGNIFEYIICNYELEECNE